MVDDLDFARHRLASMEELGTLQNLGRDDLEVFSTIKDPFGLETKSCSKSSGDWPVLNECMHSGAWFQSRDLWVMGPAR